MAKKNAMEFGGGGNSNWVKGAATVKFSKDEKRVKIEYDKDSYTCLASLLPEVPETISEETEYFVELRMDEDGDVQQVASIRPVPGMCKPYTIWSDHP